MIDGDPQRSALPASSTKLISLNNFKEGMSYSYRKGLFVPVQPTKQNGERYFQSYMRGCKRAIGKWHAWDVSFSLGSLGSRSKEYSGCGMRSCSCMGYIRVPCTERRRTSLREGPIGQCRSLQQQQPCPSMWCISRAGGVGPQQLGKVYSFSVAGRPRVQGELELAQSEGWIAQWRSLLAVGRPQDEGGWEQVRRAW